jgi:hypothetical protein
MALGPQTVTYAGEGAYDFATKSGQLAFEVPAPEGQVAAGTIEQRVIGNDLFLMLPQQAGVYYKLLVSDVAGTSLGNSTDPTVPVQALAGVDNVEEIGVEMVRGVQTSHYTGDYDVAQAIASAEGVARTILETTIGQTGLPRVPFDVYLDEQGRMVKFEQRLERPSELTDGQPVLFSFTLELFDFGTSVTLVPPSAESTRDGAPLLVALQQATPTVPAPPGAPAPAEPPPVAPAPAEPPPVAPAPAEPPAPLPAPPAPPPAAPPEPPAAPPEPPAPPPAPPAG